MLNKLQSRKKVFSLFLTERPYYTLNKWCQNDKVCKNIAKPIEEMKNGGIIDKIDHNLCGKIEDINEFLKRYYIVKVLPL